MTNPHFLNSIYRWTSRALLSAALAAIGSTAIAAPAPGTDPLRIPPLAFHEHSLPNGLHIVTAEDHGSPTVSVQVWYRVGSKDDPQGRSGFAHLFEHMMFKGTKYMRDEQLDRMTEDVGGNNNASTWDDLTNYFEVVPSNHLQPLLWAEAERMAHLAVSEANFKSERAVVEEEFRQRILAQPYGRFFYAIEKDSFRVHPYKRPGIGSIEDLEASSLADVVAFHNTFYRPDNAVLIVTGDFDSAQLAAWIDKYFGALTTPVTPIPRVKVVEPAWPDDRHFTETAPGVPLPAVAISWLGPKADDADVPALNVLEGLLSAGESSRLNQALVYRGQLASQAGFSLDVRVDASLLIAYSITASGHSVEQSIDAILEQIGRVVTQPIKPAELDKVKTQLLTQALIERQTPLGKGMQLGRAALIGGDAARVNKELTDLQAVTAEDVQRVAMKYLLAAHRNIIEYRAASPATGASS